MDPIVDICQNLDMVYELNRRKNICTSSNTITLHYLAYSGPIHIHNIRHIQNPGILESIVVFTSLSLVFAKHYFLDHFRCLAGF